MAARKRPALKPRKVPRQERALQTVDAILKASAYILKKQGFGGLNTNAVAEEAGVNIASVYQYFPNKEAILVELIRRHAEETRKRTSAVLREPGAGESFEKRMEQAIEASIAVHSVDPELHAIFTQEGARLRLERFETESDAAIEEESQKWVRSTKRANAEMALWIAQTAIHAVVHSAFVARPDIAKDPAFAKELAKLTQRYLR